MSHVAIDRSSPLYGQPRSGGGDNDDDQTRSGFDNGLELKPITPSKLEERSHMSTNDITIPDFANMPSTEKRLQIEKITLDPDVQVRGITHRETVRDYAQQKKEGYSFPPIVIFTDGLNNYLADGWHRLEADRLNDVATVACQIYEGCKDDAILFAIWKNRTQLGISWDKEARERSVLHVHRLHPDWSDHLIQRATAVPRTTVWRLREAERRRTGETKPAKVLGTDNRRQSALKPRDLNPQSDKHGNPVVTHSGDSIPKPVQGLLGDDTIRSTVQFLQLTITELRRRPTKLANLGGSPAGMYLRPVVIEDIANRAIPPLASIAEHLEPSILTDVCPACKGSGCNECRDLGAVPESVYRNLTLKMRRDGGSAR
jgi:hypothetical protein